MGQALVGQFDEMGGSIGRADNNQLVLPDPERTISRVHARVAYRNGGYVIIDCGSNPVSVNNRPLGNGQESALKAGDQVSIGGYAIKVELGGAGGHKVPDPFADFAGLAVPAAPPRGAVAARADPLAGFASPASGGLGSPFGAPPAANTAASSASGIPDDWNPFAPEAAVASKGRNDPFAPAGSRSQDFGMEIGGKGAGPLIPDFGPASHSSSSSADSLDNLFGLGAVSSSNASSDPFANSPLQAVSAQPNMAAHADPLKSLNSLTRASSTAAADNTSELSSPFNLPPMVVAAPKIADPSATLPPGRAAAPSGAILSWGDTQSEGRTIIRARGAGATRTPAAAPVSAPKAALPADLEIDFGFDFDAAPAKPSSSPLLPDGDFDFLAPAPSPAPSPTPPPAPVPAAPSVPARPAAAAVPAPTPAVALPSAAGPAAPEMAALVAALREGLGVAGLPIERLTPELMKLIGQLLHEATRGTVDLLTARAALKREVRAEITMIRTKENNPLKFSPTAEVALDHLLKPPVRGFMAPDKAMRDAYDDLRAHQFGFLAGMRAALEGVLKRFDPAVLEGKLTQRSILSSMIPGSRKARMWDVFQDHYTLISNEASDDFHELFGKEFLRAYEAQLDQLHNERN